MTMPPVKTGLLLTGVILLTATLTVSSSSPPCAYSDTVNLTGHQKYPDGSYLYDGTIIPANLTAIFKYTADIASEEIPVAPHVRGCICKLRTCVQFCCPHGQEYNGGDVKCQPSTSEYSTVMEVVTRQGTVDMDVTKQFVVQIAQPCQSMYYLLPYTNDYDQFTLFENGTLLRIDDMEYLDKSEYCLSAVKENETLPNVLVPVNCYPPVPSNWKPYIYAIAMLCSIPFMVLTMIVYISLPELRTLHGKSLCCYLLGLTIGCSILASFNLLLPDVSNENCSFFGFTAYFSFMSSFFWLSVISFDLYSNIRAIRGGVNKTKRFIIYCIYAYGMAFIFLALTWYAQRASWVNYDYKPAIGSNEYCWLNVRTGWSAMIYFYGPIIILIGFNVVMFVLTSVQINSVQREMSRMMARNESQSNLRREKDRLAVFVRLFILMGVTWTMEIISYCIGSNTEWDKLFYITDILNSIQGLVIFILFVLKRKIRQYIVNRLSSSISERTGTITSTMSTASGSDKPLIMRPTNAHN